MLDEPALIARTHGESDCIISRDRAREAGHSAAWPVRPAPVQDASADRFGTPYAGPDRGLARHSRSTVSGSRWRHAPARALLQPYSIRSAISGSLPAARRAGSQHAMAATQARTTITVAYETASSGETSNSSDAIARVASMAPATPMTMPAAVSVIPCRMIIRRMAAGDAPSAVRTPISRMRSATLAETTP